MDLHSGSSLAFGILSPNTRPGAPSLGADVGNEASGRDCALSDNLSGSEREKPGDRARVLGDRGAHS
ncbi:hypothetical protein R6Z07F_001655 [Ovis aries]